MMSAFSTGQAFLGLLENYGYPQRRPLVCRTGVAATAARTRAVDSRLRPEGFRPHRSSTRACTRNPTTTGVRISQPSPNPSACFASSKNLPPRDKDRKSIPARAKLGTKKNTASSASDPTRDAFVSPGNRHPTNENRVPLRYEPANKTSRGSFHPVGDCTTVTIPHVLFDRDRKDAHRIRRGAKCSSTPSNPRLPCAPGCVREECRQFGW